jgi:segregation and condensation protein B
VSDHPKHPTENEMTVIEESGEEIVSFVPGSSVIDIGELRRAQNAEAMDLNIEAREILEAFESDPEMKEDVLAEFDSHRSNEEMVRIADAVSSQTEEDIAQMEELSIQVADEMKEMNSLLIAEDRMLEDESLRNQLLSPETLETESTEDSVTTEEMSEEDSALKAALPKCDPEGNYDLEDLQSCIDTLLFYSDKSLSLKKIKDMLELTEADDAPILEAISLLKESYRARNRGFEIAEIAGGFQLRTKIEKAPLLRKLAKVQIQRLSRGAMETLTICAYKQPCTKDDIDQIRGVDSSHFIRTLLDRKLIEVTGRSEAPGRPMIYQTTDTFLEVFGLMDLSGLPPLREIEAMVPQLGATEEGAEDPRVIQMRKMVSQMKIEANHLDYDAKEDEKILQEIRDRVKSIDISTPYLERQKALAAQGITGEEAEEILAREFGFDQALSGGEAIQDPAPQTPPEDQLSLDEIAEIIQKNAIRDLEPEAT